MIEQIKASPIVPVFFNADPEYACEIVSACYDGGLRFFEFTNRGPEALEVFSKMVLHVQQHCPGMHLGIGTIYTPETAIAFIESGAQFIVQPITTAAVGKVCQERKTPWIPGAMTLNEIWNAAELGATLVKVFPGNLVGPDYIRAIRGPLPQVPLMITGGVEPTVESITAWMNAGVQAVGIGSQLFKGDFKGNYPALAQRIAGLLQHIK